jgi:hypothetical protein
LFVLGDPQGNQFGFLVSPVIFYFDEPTGGRSFRSVVLSPALPLG